LISKAAKNSSRSDSDGARYSQNKRNKVANETASIYEKPGIDEEKYFREADRKECGEGIVWYDEANLHDPWHWSVMNQNYVSSVTHLYCSFELLRCVACLAMRIKTIKNDTAAALPPMITAK
jgi:hypothetical protein